jgi:hypothetical protein
MMSLSGCWASLACNQVVVRLYYELHARKETIKLKRKVEFNDIPAGKLKKSYIMDETNQSMHQDTKALHYTCDKSSRFEPCK